MAGGDDGDRTRFFSLGAEDIEERVAGTKARKTGQSSLIQEKAEMVFQARETIQHRQEESGAWLEEGFFYEVIGWKGLFQKVRNIIRR